jgi:hypothetical protein
MIKTYNVKMGRVKANIKANGLCDLEEKIREKQTKIAFITSCRKDYDKSNDKIHQKIYDEYVKMPDEDFEIEFKYYYNK